tara:strand:- start:18 stop:542 length:525 start_codon:yes stop_codon:yes gene_type:complete
MSRTPTLTEGQMKFGELLIYESGRLSPAECAFKAGYKTRPRQSASELRNPKIYPLVAKYINELRQEVQEKYGINYQSHLQEMAKLREESRKHKQFSPAITAEKYRGQVGGLYIDRRENVNVNFELEKMSYKDLMKELSEFVDGKKEKNVTPETATLDKQESEPKSNLDNGVAKQ